MTKTCHKHRRCERRWHLVTSLITSTAGGYIKMWHHDTHKLRGLRTILRLSIWKGFQIFLVGCGWAPAGYVSTSAYKTTFLKQTVAGSQWERSDSIVRTSENHTSQCMSDVTVIHATPLFQSIFYWAIWSSDWSMTAVLYRHSHPLKVSAWAYREGGGWVCG